MKTVTMAEAQTDLARLIQAVQAGEKVSITIDGEPAATLSGPEPRKMAPEVDTRRREWLSFLDRLAEEPAQHLGKFDRRSIYDERWPDR